MQKSDNSNLIRSATKWSAITSVLRRAIYPITNMILARLLTPDAFGIVASINIVISFADVFADAGFQKYIIQHEFVDKKDLYKSTTVAFWTNLILAFIIWIIICLFRTPIVELVGSAGYEKELVVASLAIVLNSFSSIQQALFKRSFDFKTMFVPQIVSSLIPLFVTVPLAYITKSVWALILGTIASKFSDAILLTIKSNWKPNFYYSFNEFKRMFSFSAWTLLESVSIWLTLNVDIFIIGRALDSYYLGLYKTSINTVSQITSLVTAIIIPVLFSALSRCQDDENVFNTTFYSFQKKTALFLIPISVGMFVYSDVVTWLLLGNQWVEAERFIGYVGLMQSITILISNFASEVYRSKGQPKISFIIQVVYILTMTPLIIIGVRSGFETLCLYRVLLMVWFAVLHLVVLIVRYRLNLKEMINAFFSPTIASAIMALFGIWLKSLVLSMVWKTITIVACIFVYAAVCFLLPQTRRTIKGFLEKG